MYENFNASSLESLDSIFTRLQKIVSQLAILGENISQEDLNFKFLRSLPSEWSMHVVVWLNTNQIWVQYVLIDDLYNNFKIVEQETKVECFIVIRWNLSRSAKILESKNIGAEIKTDQGKCDVEESSSKLDEKAYWPPYIDLSNSGLEEFKQPEFEGYGVKVNKSISKNSSKEIKKTFGAPIIEVWVSDCDEDETFGNVWHKLSNVLNNLSKMINLGFEQSRDNGNINTTQSIGKATLNELRSLGFGLGGYTLGCDEGKKKLNELTELCTKLSEKVTSLEQDLKQTKQVYGKALTKLVKKVKHLEDQLKSITKRRKTKVVISHEEEDLISEDPSK
ncbi:hypothetical protein Tco_0579015 [Tanacetum coccineum]